MQRDEAIALLKTHVRNEGLINHCIATAAVMKAVASRMGEDENKWESIGILHDIDYEEVNGDMSHHGSNGYKILMDVGVGEDIAGPVKRHNYELCWDSDTPVDIALTASDNISGLIIACALVKGGDISAVTEKTVRKKMKDRSFAAGCNRERIKMIEKFIELPEFYNIAIEGMKNIKTELGLF
ncbi:MAG: HDIG domain-containing protein [Methanomicrobiaceae archaeon]|nr:HDIG domain-containing protein [Methanomicrobiaceae archaeon]